MANLILALFVMATSWQLALSAEGLTLLDLRADVIATDPIRTLGLPYTSVSLRTSQGQDEQTTSMLLSADRAVPLEVLMFHNHAANQLRLEFHFLPRFGRPDAPQRGDQDWTFLVTMSLNDQGLIVADTTDIQRFLQTKPNESMLYRSAAAVLDYLRKINDTVFRFDPCQRRFRTPD